MKRVLLAGESWMSYTTHVKGFDSFYTSTYETGEKWLKAALEKGGYEVDFLPNHLANDGFPFTMDEIRKYDCVILSDIGANTLLLPGATFSRSEKKPNRANLIRDYVLDGGALVMVGGYLTFSGVDAKGKWHDTAVQEVLPVEVLTVDDRMEHCEGVTPKAVKAHEVLEGIPDTFPDILGYNKTIPREGAEVLAEVEGDPFIAVMQCQKGRSAVVTTDCAPPWGPEEFCGWGYFDRLWQKIVNRGTS